MRTVAHECRDGPSCDNILLLALVGVFKQPYKLPHKPPIPYVIHLGLFLPEGRTPGLSLPVHFLPLDSPRTRRARPRGHSWSAPPDERACLSDCPSQTGL